MGKKRQFFTKEEINAFFESDDSQARIRYVFESLKEVASKGEAMSEDEITFFCIAVSSSLRSGDGTVDDYKCCQDFKFWFIYLAYHENIAGGLVYKKYDRKKAQKLHGVPNHLINPDDYLSVVPVAEVEKDLQYLYDIADAWELVMTKRNHSDPLLKALSKETRQELRGLDKSVHNDIYAKGKFKYKKEKRALLLHSKYIYFIAKSTLQNIPESDLVLKLWNNEIHITPDTIVHVMRRHFAPKVRQYIPYQHTTTYHSEDVHPRTFHIFLKEIFTTISELAVEEVYSFDKMIFTYNNKTYFISIDEDIKPSKGQNHKIWRVKTFYPIDPIQIPKDWACFRLRNGVYLHCIDTNRT